VGGFGTPEENVDKRAAKKYATEHLSEAARVASDAFASADGTRLGEAYPPSDRRRIARAYGELADELARRYSPRPRTAERPALDPAQLLLFPEAACPQDPAPTASATTPENGS